MEFCKEADVERNKEKKCGRKSGLYANYSVYIIYSSFHPGDGWKGFHVRSRAVKKKTLKKKGKDLSIYTNMIGEEKEKYQPSVQRWWLFGCIYTNDPSNHSADQGQLIFIKE